MNYIIDKIIDFIFVAILAETILKSFDSTKQCLTNLFELQTLFEKLGKLLAITSRYGSEDSKLLIKIEEIILKIYVEKNGIILPGKLIDNLLNESFKLFHRLHDINEPGNKPSMIASELLQIWGYKKFRSFDADSNIIIIQKFLMKPIYKRFYDYLICLFLSDKTI